ncbi:MAG: DUF433 domain-containing protein [Lachnospiraceae bacterium]
MMSNAVKNIMLRAINKRLAAGEKFEDIIKSYPRLTNKEIEEIKAAL